MRKIEPQNLDNEDIEIQLLLEAIYLKYGYDFRHYTRSSVKRQVLQHLSSSGLNSLLEMQQKVLYDADFFNILLQDLSISFSEMFRDPSFYRAVKAHVIPVLRTYPSIKIWHAGCSTGEEVYSMAIVLKEEDLYDRAHIYATDFNHTVLQKAKEGIYPIRRAKQFADNYEQSGGKESLERYYTVKHHSIVMDPSLASHIVFAHHNLAADEPIDEVHLIFCRNVLVYFSDRLRYQVFRLFYRSLCSQGFLCLGSDEHIRTSLYTDYFDHVIREERIYKRKKRAWNMPDR